MTIWYENFKFIIKEKALGKENSDDFLKLELEKMVEEQKRKVEDMNKKEQEEMKRQQEEESSESSGSCHYYQG